MLCSDRSDSVPKRYWQSARRTEYFVRSAWSFVVKHERWLEFLPRLASFQDSYFVPHAVMDGSFGEHLFAKSETGMKWQNEDCECFLNYGMKIRLLASKDQQQRDSLFSKGQRLCLSGKNETMEKNLVLL